MTMYTFEPDKLRKPISDATLEKDGTWYVKK